MNEFNVLKYLFDVAPVIFVMGVGYYILLGMFRAERKTNLELQEYIRNSDKQNLELLKDFSVLLNSIITISNENRDEIQDTLINEAKGIKSHIDSRVIDLQKQLLGNHKGNV